MWSAEDSQLWELAREVDAHGWVINLSRPEYSTTESRPWQRPVFFFEDGVPCYEVWFWCSVVSRWFVMSTVQHDALAEKGVVFFSPDETPDQLRARIRAIDPHVEWR